MPQCQFLFSAVFGFGNSTQEIFSELDGTKTEVHIFTVPKHKSERETKKGTRLATLMRVNLVGCPDLFGF